MTLFKSKNGCFQPDFRRRKTKDSRLVIWNTKSVREGKLGVRRVVFRKEVGKKGKTPHGWHYLTWDFCGEDRVPTPDAHHLTLASSTLVLLLICNSLSSFLAGSLALSYSWWVPLRGPKLAETHLSSCPLTPPSGRLLPQDHSCSKDQDFEDKEQTWKRKG